MRSLYSVGKSGISYKTIILDNNLFCQFQSLFQRIDIGDVAIPQLNLIFDVTILVSDGADKEIHAAANADVMGAGKLIATKCPVPKYIMQAKSFDLLWEFHNHLLDKNTGAQL